MGKVKYRKRNQSAAGSKTKKSSVSKQSSLKNKEEMKTPSMSMRHFQRRLAITPNDLSAEERLAWACQKFLQNKSVDKGHDGLHQTKQNKRARKRLLAKKKMAGAFGNMDSLVNALPAVEKDARNRSVKKKPRLSKSLKTQETEMIKDIQWYRSAIQDPAFQTDPFAAVAANIHQRLRTEQKESS
ncbi:unnamed protein product [Larinioides sclopetarius]|uniref:Ribosome biogenesis protein SLX9 n=1 Tax=Larinioides sclopetarius TaxID=280406 RepID=A0AAV2BAW7_9ARAC